MKQNNDVIIIGAGPYGLSSSGASGNGAAGSAMLYGNFRLPTEDTLSVPAFEAAAGQSPLHTSFFNNLGVYFAYDAARALDTRLRMTILLGAQIVTFAPNGLTRKAYNEARSLRRRVSGAKATALATQIRRVETFARQNRITADRVLT